ncbi:MAG: TetR/AcrR family transcriptional regulator [Saprospiraceae bacterium]|nr:TetR/AcrR family transcriptional regulator [Saprospiraceae bacterium]
MGVAERREREKQEMKGKILDTATQQIVEKGIEKTTIRSIASAIEYSPRTIYLYFKDKDEILYALSTRGFQLFAQQFEAALAIADPIERLKDIHQRYLRFAFENPALYDLMFILNNPMNADPAKEGWEVGLKGHSILKDTVQACIEAGHFKGKEATTVAFTLWSYVHGIASLKLRNRMRMYPADQVDGIIQDSSAMMLGLLDKM